MFLSPGPGAGRAMSRSRCRRRTRAVHALRDTSQALALCLLVPAAVPVIVILGYGGSLRTSDEVVHERWCRTVNAVMDFRTT